MIRKESDKEEEQKKKENYICEISKQSEKNQGNYKE